MEWSIRRRRWVVALACSLVLGAACGDDGDDDDGAPPTGGTPSARTWVVPDAAAALTADQRTAFEDGLLYFNAHTEANPAGEIRGQLDGATGTIRFAQLDGAQETPAVTTSGVGAGVLSVDEDTGEVRGFVVSDGLEDVTMAHVHLAARGTPGAVIIPLVGGPNTWVVPDDAAALTPEQVDAFLAGELYFNVHTEANPNGEIRGQLDRPGTLRLASLDGAQEVPPVTTGAFGAGLVAVDEASGQVSGFLASAELSDGTVAHIHRAARGAAGDPIVTLSGGPRLWVVPDGAAPLSEDDLAAFTDGELYLNAHTGANPNGEIRGQLDVGGTPRLATLDGAQETPPVTTEAFGGGILTVDEGSGAARGFIFTGDLTDPTVAHVHQEARGTAGGIILPLGP
jgi:hypothetical protein